MLRLSLLVLLLSQLQTLAWANHVVLEGSDGSIQFGDDPSQPSIRRVPDPKGGATDQLHIGGVSGLAVDGTITASLLDLNSTGGSVTAAELIVKSLTVTGSSSGLGSSGGCVSNGPRIALRTAGNSLSRSDTLDVAGIAGMTSVNVWGLDVVLSHDFEAVFTFTNNQTITVEQDGYYAVTFDDFRYPSAADYRHVALDIAVNGTLITGTGIQSRPCANLGARAVGDGTSSSCAVKLARGSVLGCFLSWTSSSTMFQAVYGIHPGWTVTQTSTY